MREYGQIQSAYWTHPDIKHLPDKAKVLGAYLLTCRHTNGLGCFQMPIGYIQADFGWSERDVKTALETLSKPFEKVSEGFEKGFLSYCERSEFVLIHSFLRWNPITNGNVAKARVTEFDQIPSKFLYFHELADSIKKFGAFFPEDFLNRLETLSKPFRNPTRSDPTQNRPEPEPEPDPNQNRSIVALTPDAAREIFDFWRTTMNHPKAAFSEDRRRLINRWLKHYAMDDLTKAIQGCAVTPHNMGSNDNGEVYDSIELIFRNAKQIDRFMRNADHPPPGNRKTIDQTRDEAQKQGDRVRKKLGIA